ncbi:hypothetical protein D6D24_10465 [Aureobasidium pullulans]|uniref:Uncharacterized protein n=1 Tax=Aureobasidium pullulans TaxID=5580 RepID=A0A4S8V397_AURPU|nr:hypothetical protein D6D24_10465 [Aureobasidium pullulans]
MSAFANTATTGPWRDGCESQVINLVTEFINHHKISHQNPWKAPQAPVESQAVATQIKAHPSVTSTVKWALKVRESTASRRDLLKLVIEAGVLTDRAEVFFITLLAENNYLGLPRGSSEAEALLYRHNGANKGLDSEQEQHNFDIHQRRLNQLEACGQELFDMTESGREGILDLSACEEQSLRDMAAVIKREFAATRKQISDEKQELLELLERVRFEKQQLLDTMSVISSTDSTVDVYSPTSTLRNSSPDETSESIEQKPEPHLKTKLTLLVGGNYPGLRDERSMSIGWNDPIGLLRAPLKERFPEATRGFYHGARLVSDDTTPAQVSIFPILVAERLIRTSLASIGAWVLFMSAEQGLPRLPRYHDGSMNIAPSFMT